MSEPLLHKTLARMRDNNAWFECASTPRASPCSRLDGVNIAGYFRDESGWGSAGRRYLQAIRHTQTPVALCDLSSITSNRSSDSDVTSFDHEHPHSVNLICVDARHHYGMMAEVGREFFDNRYNVGIWAWELARFPDELYDRFAYYQEIWVATSFIADVLGPIAPTPVVRMPPVLTNTAPASRERGRSLINAFADETVFLFIFDFHSHMARKNPGAAIEAFASAFRRDDNTRLVLKCVNEQADPDGYALLKSKVGAARIDILTGYWSAEDMRDLTAGCDAYVSLHRSEGTGLTITDAMALGRPVIATDWSGNTDFMDATNSLPVKYALTQIDETVGPYRKGETWAEPCVEHAAHLMRRVYENWGEATVIGQAAATRIARDYSCEAIAARVHTRLQTISALRDLPAYSREVKAFYGSYKGLVSDVRSVVDAVVRDDDADVLVVSKGDPDLLAYGGPRASHFPATDEGIYCGFHPPDSAWAINHLEAARSLGAMYLVVPGTSLWWLDHYEAFREHLDAHYARLHQDARCAIYDLRGRSPSPGSEKEVACQR